MFATPPFWAKGRPASWLARSGSVAPPTGPEFDSHQKRISGCWGKKKTLVVLAARLDPLGHGPGFGGFIYPDKPVWLSLNEKTMGPFPSRVEFFFQA